MREVVFNYHIQNTYNVQDWEILLRQYNRLTDLIEQRRFLTALSYTKLPWLLSRFFVAPNDGGVYDELGFFEEIALLSRNPLGRELAWDLYRINYTNIISTYGKDDVRIGRALIDIASTFENEFLYIEVIFLLQY